MNKESVETKIIEELPKKLKKSKENQPRRGSSIAGLKSLTSTSNFNPN